MLLPEPDVTTPEPEMPVAVELPLPTPVAPLVTAVMRVDAVKTVPLGTVVAPVATTAVPLTVETADAVAVTAPLVPALIAAIEKMIVSGCYGRGIVAVTKRTGLTLTECVAYAGDLTGVSA